MSLVTASIQIDAPTERVWQVVMDPRRLDAWVTIHRRLLSSDPPPTRHGFHMHQQLQLRGVRIDVRWTLVECEPCELAVWEGRGPARSRARTEYRLRPQDGGTCFDYRNEFHAPLGPVGAIASRALTRGVPDREARRSLERLRDVVENRSAVPGTQRRSAAD